jgi:FkbM family methyltransferase
MLLLRTYEYLLPKLERRLGIGSADLNQKVLSLLLEEIDENSVVIDVGANLGNFSELIRRLNPKRRIIAIEPQPELASGLRQIVGENGSVYSIGCGDLKSEFKLFRSNVSDSKATLDSSRSENFILVKVETLESILLIEHCEKIGILKVDTEGYDFNVLQGLNSLWESNPPKIIIFEIMWRSLMLGNTPNDIGKFLQSKGYNFFYRTSPYLGLVPIKNTLTNESVKTQNIVAAREKLNSGNK